MSVTSRQPKKNPKTELVMEFTNPSGVRVTVTHTPDPSRRAVLERMLAEARVMLDKAAADKQAAD